MGRSVPVLFAKVGCAQRVSPQALLAFNPRPLHLGFPGGSLQRFAPRDLEVRWQQVVEDSLVVPAFRGPRNIDYFTNDVLHSAIHFSR